MCLLAEVFPLTLTVREQTSKSAKTIYWNSLWQPNATIRIRRDPRGSLLRQYLRYPSRNLWWNYLRGRLSPENYLDQKQLAWKGRRLTTLGDQT